MKAMVFAAGVGSRLGELTKATPKCLMQAGGKTMLEHVIDHLKAVGVTEVAINLHHHPEQIKQLVAQKSSFGLQVVFSQEQELLNTGGGLKNLRSFFEGEERFIVHNSDVYCTHSLALLVDEHRNRGALATLAVMKRSSKRGLFFDSEMRLAGWTEEKMPVPDTMQLRAFGGISVCSGEIFQFMDERSSFSIIEPLLRASRATGRVVGHEIDANTWIDIGTPEQLAVLQKRLA
jgi:MurNAc alpha-1-phosphate uridylyltransferase